MSHSCQALVIACIDFRLIDNTTKWADQLGLNCDYDLLTIGGASKQIANPDKPEYRELLLNNIKISVELHNNKKIYLVHHEDCGAYGGKAVFKDDNDEYQTHVKDMTTSQAVINELYPEVEVVKVYEKLNGDMEIIK